MKLVAGPLIGYRGWEIDKDHVLRSLNDKRVWIPRMATEAKCDQPHPVPARECTCGWYAYREAANAEGALRGEVALWGRVVAHERGWRSQFAYPLSLWADPGLEASVLYGASRVYGCRVGIRPMDKYHRGDDARRQSAQDKLRLHLALEQEFGPSVHRVNWSGCSRTVLPFRLFNVRTLSFTACDAFMCCLLQDATLQRIAELKHRGLSLYVGTYGYSDINPQLHGLFLMTLDRCISVTSPWPCTRRSP